MGVPPLSRSCGGRRASLRFSRPSGRWKHSFEGGSDARGSSAAALDASEFTGARGQRTRSGSPCGCAVSTPHYVLDDPHWSIAFVTATPGILPHDYAQGRHDPPRLAIRADAKASLGGADWFYECPRRPRRPRRERFAGVGETPRGLGGGRPTYWPSAPMESCGEGLCTLMIRSCRPRKSRTSVAGSPSGPAGSRGEMTRPLSAGISVDLDFPRGARPRL